MNEEQIEQEIQAKNLNAPRLTPELIDKTIIKAEYHVFDNKTTVCNLILKNGFKVIGESACVDKRNYNKELGEKIARNNARDKIWVLEGYLLQQKLHEKRSKG